MRHTCASLLLAQGVHLRVVMEILGHSQISLTMNTYSHVIPQLQADAAQRMDNLLTDLPPATLQLTGAPVSSALNPATSPSAS